MNYKKSIVGVFTAVAFFTPLMAGAITTAELQNNIQSLLSMVASLQQQLSSQPVNNYGGYTGVNYQNPTYGARPWWCDSFTDVRYGSYSNRVAQLQGAMGYATLGSNPTGYYGPLTYNAWNRSCGQYQQQQPVTINNPANDYTCQSWYDGCNSCSRSSLGGSASCTQRACIQQGTPYCTAHFGNNGNNNGGYNRPPSITSFSGPTTLDVDERGKWKIRANDPENDTLKYSVEWGDEYRYAYSASSVATSFTQSTSFTHRYEREGVFTITITVRDENGAEAQTTTTVRVIGDNNGYCDAQYAPVCGSTPGYCWSGGYDGGGCTSGTRKTYSNICMMNAQGATLEYHGSCN